jgi:hypothetical protein
MTKLALRELEAAAGAPLTIFLAFHHPGVPGKVAVVSEAGIVTLIHLTECPGQAMTASAGLTVGPAAVDVDQYVKFVFIGGDYQRLADRYRMLRLGKINTQIPAVDNDFSASIPNIHPGNGVFSSSGPNTKILYHVILP